MNSLTEIQKSFLTSTLKNIIQNMNGAFFIKLSEQSNNQSLIHIKGDNSQAIFECFSDQQKSLQHLSFDDALNMIIDQMDEQKKIAIEHDDGIETIQLKGQKIVREKSDKPKNQLANPRWAIGKATHLDPEQAAPLLKLIGLMTEDGQIKAPMRRKFKQINHFLDLVIPVIKKSSSSRFTLVDCGCGKTYLGFVLYWYIRKVLKLNAQFYGVDVSEKLINRCQQQAKQLGLEMNFQCSPIIEAKLSNKIDLLVSLHACDTATDEALAKGIIHQAKNILAVPCCQQEIANQLDGVPYYPLKKHGIFTNRFGDLLTDMARSLFLEANGYTVTAGEFVSTEETPKNLMLRASKGNPNQQQRQAEFEAFCCQYRIFPSIQILTQGLEVQAINS